MVPSSPDQRPVRWMLSASNGMVAGTQVSAAPRSDSDSLAVATPADVAASSRAAATARSGRIALLMGALPLPPTTIVVSGHLVARRDRDPDAMVAPTGSGVQRHRAPAEPDPIAPTPPACLRPGFDQADGMTASVRIFADADALGETLAEEITVGIERARRADRRYVLGCPSGRSARSTPALPWRSHLARLGGALGQPQ